MQEISHIYAVTVYQLLKPNGLHCKQSANVLNHMHSPTAMAACLESILSMPMWSPRLITELQKMRPNILGENSACPLRHSSRAKRSCQEPPKFRLRDGVQGAVVDGGELVFYLPVW